MDIIPFIKWTQSLTKGELLYILKFLAETQGPAMRGYTMHKCEQVFKEGERMIKEAERMAEVNHRGFCMKLKREMSEQEIQEFKDWFKKSVDIIHQEMDDNLAEMWTGILDRLHGVNGD